MKKSREVCGVYLLSIARPGDLPLYYVGGSNHCARRKTHHLKVLKAQKHQNPVMQAAYNQHGGRKSVSFSVLEEVPREHLRSAEQWWLDEIHGHARVLNIAKDAIAPNLGRVFPEETRAKVRAAQEMRPPMTAEQRQQISIRMQGSTLSAESRRKLSATQKARYASDPSIKKIGKQHRASKPVEGRCLATGKTVRFESARQAKAGGYDQSAVSKVCRGEARQYKGFAWRYLECA